LVVIFTRDCPWVPWGSHTPFPLCQVIATTRLLTVSRARGSLAGRGYPTPRAAPIRAPVRAAGRSGDPFHRRTSSISARTRLTSGATFHAALRTRSQIVVLRGSNGWRFGSSGAGCLVSGTLRFGFGSFIVLLRFQHRLGFLLGP